MLADPIFAAGVSASAKLDGAGSADGQAHLIDLAEHCLDLASRRIVCEMISCMHGLFVALTGMQKHIVALRALDAVIVDAQLVLRGN